MRPGEKLGPNEESQHYADVGDFILQAGGHLLVYTGSDKIRSLCGDWTVRERDRKQGDQREDWGGAVLARAEQGP